MDTKREFKWDDKEKRLTVTTQMSEDMSEAQVVGVYENMVKQISMGEAQLKEARKNLAELKPYYDKLRHHEVK